MANKINPALLIRAKIYTKIRKFFAKRRVLEVETPLLLPSTNPSLHLDNFVCDKLYLQSSPEFAMKRLLAAGSGDIYQICKSFRKGELGRLHNPEFSMLEWYRIDFDHHQLMDEVEELLIYLLKTPQAKRFSYQEVCRKYLGINPHLATAKQLKTIAKKHDLIIPGVIDDQDSWLQLLFTHLVEPKLEHTHPIFIYDFPVAQAMLAKVRSKKLKVASRFELYYRGVELANGFHELNDPKEQLKRFNQELAQRTKLNLPIIPIDNQLIKNLAKLPNCSGVALGLDRLIMLVSDFKSLDEVIPLRKNQMM